METFDYPFHTIGDEYPESSTVVRFGRGYSFASQPKGPDQILFHLNLTGFCWWTEFVTGNIDRTIFPQLNAGHIQDFYESHRLYEPFAYQHPTRGLSTVRFAKPLPSFKSIKDAVIERLDYGIRGHSVEPFQIDLILLP